MQREQPREYQIYKAKETEPSEEPPIVRLRYGSERFENVTTNNHNEIFLMETPNIMKIVLGKDVVLVLPRKAAEISLEEPFPTHQEAWTPLWFNIIYHSQHENKAGLGYKQELLNRIPEKDHQLLRKSLLAQAWRFWEEYQEKAKGISEPRKRFKGLTRILQDTLLYLDAPKKKVIQNQQEYLDNHKLAPLVKLANALRRGERLNDAPELEKEIDGILRKLTEEFGGQEMVEAAFDEIKKRMGDFTSEVIIFEDRTIDDDIETAQLLAHDFLIAEDEHDQDVISIIPRLKEPLFCQTQARFGQRLSKSRRKDIIAIPEDIRIWDVVRAGKESYQPISMIIATHTHPVSEEGERLFRRLTKETELSPDNIAQHYLGAAREFLYGTAWGKSWEQRKDREDLPSIKKVIPLYRVACDLLPRAVYMLKHAQHPAGVPEEEIWKIGETLKESETIKELFARQKAAQEELEELAEKIKERLEKWYKPKFYKRFSANMERMKQGFQKSREEGNEI